MEQSKKLIFTLVLWFITWAAYHDTLREFEEAGMINRYAMPWDWFLLDPLAKWVCK